MKPTPPGWPRISSSAWYEDPAKAIDWLCNAFGFEVRLKVEGDDGSILHSELVFGEGVVMVGSAKKESRPGSSYRQSPRMIGGANTRLKCPSIPFVLLFCGFLLFHICSIDRTGPIVPAEPQQTYEGCEEKFAADKQSRC